MASPSSRFVLLDRRTLSISIALILALAFAVPALADYLGPDRVTTEFQLVHVPEKDVWTLTHVDPDDGFADVCLIIHPCSEHPSVERQNALCGWTADNSGCTEWWEEQEVTVTYPEATIAAELQNCDLVDGWCTSSPTLNLTGSEPVAGETITLIEGTRNGEVFACAGASCGVPLLQGQNDFTFWAHSSWGDTSQMGTLSAKVDSQGPSLGIPDEWHIWEPLAIQVDDPRGVELIELTVKGGEYGNRTYQWNLANLPGDWIWDRYFGEIVATIGEYPVTVEAWDALGNGSTAHGTIVIPAPEAEASSDTGEPAAVSDTSSSPDDQSTEHIGSSDDGPGAGGDSDSIAVGGDDLSESGSETSDDDPDVARDSADNGAVSEGMDGLEVVTGDGSAAFNPPASESASVPVSQVLWGQAALSLAGVAAGYGALRRAARQSAADFGTSAELATPRDLSWLPDRPEPDAVQSFLDWLTLRAGGASGVVDTVSALAQNTDTSPSALTALWRLLRPEVSPNPTWTQMQLKHLLQAAQRGDFDGRIDDLLREVESIAPANRRPASINATDLKQFIDGMRRGDVWSGGADVLSVALILAAERAMATDADLGTLLRRLGGSLGATSDLYVGGRLLTSQARFSEYLQLAGTRLGVFSTLFGGFAGGVQYLSGLARLIFDPSIGNLRSNERWGVFGQALGGGFLAVGSLASLLIAAGITTGAIAASLTVLIPVGLMAAGIGYVVENWDWIGEGLSAWSGVFKNAGTIARAIPDYVNDTVVQPVTRAVNERLIEPVRDRISAWAGVAENGRKIVEALPEYVNSTVVRPVTEAISERIIEPTRTGLQAWGGVIENGRTIVRALPDYFSETIIRPASRAITENVVRPVTTTVNQNVIQPTADLINRRIVHPASSFRTNVVQPIARTVDQLVVRPVANAVNSGINAIRGLFGGH